MGPIRVVQMAAKNKDWEPTQERIDELIKAWENGELGTIAPDLLRMYLEDAIPMSQIAKAWKIPSEVVLKMYQRAGII